MNIEQIVFDNNGCWYRADRCEGAGTFDFAYVHSASRMSPPDFEGQVQNGDNFGIQVVECSRSLYDEATEQSGGADGYYTDDGSFWVDANGKFAARAESSLSEDE